MNDLLLIVTIAGRDVALRSSEVDSVLEIETISPVPRAPPHIAGLSTLRSRVLTVIDCQRSLGFASGEQPAGTRQAVVVERDRHGYALLVDRVEDVVEAQSGLLPVKASQGRGWQAVSLGMVETACGIFNLIDPLSLIAGPEAVRTA